MNICRWIAAGTLAGVLVLSGCTNNPVTSNPRGEQSTTISAENAGALTFESIDEADDAQEMLAISSPAPEDLFDLSVIPSLDPAGTLSKKQQSGDQEITIDSSDGVLHIYATASSDAGTKSDTLDLILDATITDELEGNESIISLRGTVVSSNGNSVSYLVEDRDGDGIINGPEPPQKAALVITSCFAVSSLAYKAGKCTIAEFEVDAGDDNDFDTDSDNRIYNVSWVKVNGDDTLAYAFFTDADGDGIITETGEGTVDIQFYDKDNPLMPLVDYGKVTARIERDADGKEITIRYAAEQKLVTGRLNRAWVTTSSGDSTITAGEMVHLHFATNSPAVSDSEITAQALLVIDPGENFGDVTDNSLHEITLAKSYRLGLADSATFHCTFDPPVPNGEEPEGGTFELETIWQNGKESTLVGTFSDGVIEATFTGPEGKVTEVTLKEGEV
jgi:hypothetical protein